MFPQASNLTLLLGDSKLPLLKLYIGILRSLFQGSSYVTALNLSRQARVPSRLKTLPLHLGSVQQGDLGAALSQAIVRV